MRHPYQVRRLRSVFGSGRACRNSCDFRQLLRPARRELPGSSARDLRRSPPGHPRPYRSARPRLLLLSHHGHRGSATASPALYHAQPQTPPFSHNIPYAPTPPARPLPLPAPCPPARAPGPRIRGKPFLTAGNALADYSESPTARTSWERIEGVSRSLPFSDLLALTSSHMFFSVMN